jgi:hypothetical protein
MSNPTPKTAWGAVNPANNNLYVGWSAHEVANMARVMAAPLAPSTAARLGDFQKYYNEIIDLRSPAATPNPPAEDPGYSENW